MPFIAKWNKKIEAGSESTQLISNVDMLATFLALTKQDETLLKNKDSVNVLPALLGNPEKPLREELVLAPRREKNLALRKGKWIYIPARGSGGFSGSHPGQHAWGGAPAIDFVGSENSDIKNGKILKNAPKAQLYNLETDVNQTKNLHNDHPEIVAEMKERLKSFRQ